MKIEEYIKGKLPSTLKVEERKGYVKIPLQDSNLNVVGKDCKVLSHRIRWREGNDGIIIPSDFFLREGERVVVTEGFGDLSVAVKAGERSVGRPGCWSGIPTLKSVCHGQEVLIVADNDYAGLKGASELEAALTFSDVRIVVPPRGYKDLREFYLDQGLTAVQNWFKWIG